MNVRLSKNLLVAAGVHKPNDYRFEKHTRWRNDDEKFTFDIRTLTEKELRLLEKKTDGDTEWKGLNYKIKTFFRLKVDPTGVTVSSLERLELAIKSYIGGFKNKWLFKEAEDGIMLPYYLVKAEYHPAQRSRYDGYIPPYVTLDLVSSRGKERVEYVKGDVKGMNVAQLLEKEGWFVENDELIERYMKDVEHYLQEKGNTGKQFLATGHAVVESVSWYRSSSSVAMERDGRASKVVMDNDYEKAESNKSSRNDDGDDETVPTNYWLTQEEVIRRKEILESDDENAAIEAEKLVPLKITPPLHPYVNVFDLKEHDFIEIHISNLQPYVYDETVNDKLVLPKAKKDLVGVLVQGANFLMEDIIQGKTGGIIVLATGIPGTGKTLTAEVYAETIKKPLYTVQCSQLGTSANSIESELQKVLSRASRWGAILLIDEADVYVRERGMDIEQNAIVGVFLRVLEYYRGVLFMTSNRATIIDDAVMSRATAHIVYDSPDESARARIWEVLSKQFGMKLIGSYTSFAQEFPDITGRTIKNLLKLSMLLAKKDKRPLDVALVRSAAEFIDGTNKQELPRTSHLRGEGRTRPMTARKG